MIYLYLYIYMHVRVRKLMYIIYIHMQNMYFNDAVQHDDYFNFCLVCARLPSPACCKRMQTVFQKWIKNYETMKTLYRTSLNIADRWFQNPGFTLPLGEDSHATCLQAQQQTREQAETRLFQRWRYNQSHPLLLTTACTATQTWRNPRLNQA